MDQLWKWGLVLLVVGVAAFFAFRLLGPEPGPGPAVAPEPIPEPVVEVGPPFGGEDDVAYADSLWDVMEGYTGWESQTEVMDGGSPHGALVRIYTNTLQILGVEVYVIVKDNYGGEDATIETVSAAPADYLVAVTVMAQREPGYDPENGDWYWAKYFPAGSLDVNPAGVPLAGRVAKGADTGCIACHASAEGGDYLFTE